MKKATTTITPAILLWESRSTAVCLMLFLLHSPHCKMHSTIFKTSLDRKCQVTFTLHCLSGLNHDTKQSLISQADITTKKVDCLTVDQVIWVRF